MALSNIPCGNVFNLFFWRLTRKLAFDDCMLNMSTGKLSSSLYERVTCRIVFADDSNIVDSMDVICDLSAFSVCKLVKPLNVSDLSLFKLLSLMSSVRRQGSVVFHKKSLRCVSIV